MDIIIRDNDDNIVEQYTESLKRTLEDTVSVYDLTATLLNMYEEITAFRDFLKDITDEFDTPQELHKVVKTLTAIIDEVDL